MYPNDPGVAIRIPERHIHIAGKAGIDGGLGHWILLHLVDTLFGPQHIDNLVTFEQLQFAPNRRVVGPLDFTHAIEAERDVTHRRSLPRQHAQVRIAFIRFHHGDADDEHSDAQMRQQHAPIATGLQAQARPCRARTRPCVSGPLTQVDQCGGDDPERHQKPHAG